MLNQIFSKIAEAAPTKWRRIFNHDGFRRYFANTGWMFTGQFFSLVVAFFVGAWVARYLGPAQYGILNYVISFAGLFSFLASLGIDNILTRELVSRPEKRDELLGTAWRLKLAGGFLALAGASVAILFVEKDALIRLLVFLFSFSFIFQAAGVVLLFFQAEVKARRNTKVQMIASLISAVLKIVLILSGLGLGWLVVIYALETLLLGIGFFWSYRGYGLTRSAWKFNPDLARRLWRDAWPLMLSIAAAFVLLRIDQVMIGLMLGKAEVGLYAAAAKVSEVWYFVPGIICVSLFPAIVNALKTDRELYRQRLKHLYSLLLFLALGISIPIAFLAESIIVFLFGPAYAAAAPILQIYIWSGIGLFISYGLGQELTAENRTRTVFVLNLSAMILNILLNLWLIPRAGLTGAAWATLISYSFSAVFVFHRRRPNEAAPKNLGCF